MRTSLPKSFIALDELAKKKTKPVYGRDLTVLKWTPMIGGSELSEFFSDYPSQVCRFRLSTLMTDLRSGFTIPLRSPNPASRAGFGFLSKMRRGEIELALQEHGWALHSASWAAHIRILQHAVEKKAYRKPLTKRQATYLDLLSQGLLDKQIAHEMGISHSAVRKYQYTLADRLNVSRRVEIIPKAIELGYLKTQSQKKTHQWQIGT